MGDHSAIEWTEATWNPTTGCDRTSPGCDRCYALTLSKRLKAMGQAKYQNDGDPRTSGPGFGLTLHPDTLEIPRTWTSPRTIFVNSMSDLFHPDVPEDYIHQVVDVIRSTSQHQYQVLTKRSKRLADIGRRIDWPANLWMGVSIETTKYRFRVDHLRQVDAAIRFVSAEPLLGPIPDLELDGIHWLIVGGESGPGARPIEEAWVLDLRDQCAAAGVPFFFKQWGGRTPKAGGRELRGTTHDAMPTQPERRGMTPRRSGWDWWSEVKLRILAEYLRAFTLAVRGRSAEAIYLDLFAGSFDNQKRHDPGTFAGSARIALENEPPFTRLAFFELPDKAARLEADITAARPDDRRWRVFPGDSNVTLPSALQRMNAVRWAPTFAFLDPRGLQVAWSTIEALAAWRKDKKTKVEQWILLAEPALARVLGLRGASGRRSAARLDRLYGTDDWIAIHQLRRRGLISPEVMRAEFVNLLRWRLERHLGYRTTHALQLVNTSGVPVYTLVFATDSDPGDRIMRHVYNSTATRTIPAMQAQAQWNRQLRRDDDRGVSQLPGLEAVEPSDRRSAAGYDHVPPWEPPVPVDDRLDLEGEPDIDPDDLDLDAWVDDVERGDG